jgi:hypothetical protein
MGRRRRARPQQGPNYALAKRLQRWRAITAREAGTPSRSTSLRRAGRRP